MRFMVKVCVWVCFHLGWVCPFQLSRSDLFNRNDFLEFLAPYSFKIVFRFFQNCIMQPCAITQKGSLSLNLNHRRGGNQGSKNGLFCDLSWLVAQQTDTHRHTCTVLMFTRVWLDARRQCWLSPVQNSSSSSIPSRGSPGFSVAPLTRQQLQLWAQFIISVPQLLNTDNSSPPHSCPSS